MKSKKQKAESQERNAELPSRSEEGRVERSERLRNLDTMGMPAGQQKKSNIHIWEAATREFVIFG